MIDLRKKGLPNTITVDGKSFLIKTDFREWIKFGEIVKNKGALVDELFFLFQKDIPNKPFVKELLEFYVNANATPNQTGNSSNVEAINYVLDGEYLFGTYKQVYNVDLTEVDLHWHKFKAMLLCLPDNSKMAYIMQTRSYEPSKTKHEEQLAKNKLAWSFPVELTEEEQQDRDELNKYFK